MNEDGLRDTILDYIQQSFCNGCRAWRQESDTGQWYCPCGEDIMDSECYRNREWWDIEHETEIFLENIRNDWAYKD